MQGPTESLSFLSLEHLKPLLSTPWQRHWSTCHHFWLGHPPQPLHWSSCCTLAPPAVCSLHGSWKDLEVQINSPVTSLPTYNETPKQLLLDTAPIVSRRSSGFLLTHPPPATRLTLFHIGLYAIPEHSKHNPTSGPLHVLAWRPVPSYSHAGSFSSFRSQFKYHLFREALPPSP